jgi:hypothetical protein
LARCPIAYAIAIPRRPDTKNLSDSEAIGGAYWTIIRAEVKADDHIRANESPIKIARKSIMSPRMKKGPLMPATLS